MNQDFRDLLAEFNAHRVEHLVVGAHALAAHGHVRATKDLDVWVRPDPDNASRGLSALIAFGAPLHDFSAPTTVHAKLLSKLMDSREESPISDPEATWVAGVRRRLALYHAGELKAVPMEQAILGSPEGPLVP